MWRVRRDYRPLAAAGTTAVVSVGLLAMAASRGWLGPDVGRGSGFCEAARDALVRQPANTFSNAGFIIAGLAIAVHAGRPQRIGAVLTRPLATAMACLVVLLGPASAAMHATQSALGGRLDMLSMYLIAAFALAYATMRWLRRGAGVLAGMFFGGIVVCELVENLGGPVPVVMTSGNAVFGLLLLAAVALEVAIMRRRQTESRHIYAYASFGALTAAFVIWNITKTWLCDPYSPVQGHAIWHLLDALAAWFLYRYYASETVPVPPHALATTAAAHPAGTPGVGVSAAEGRARVAPVHVDVAAPGAVHTAIGDQRRGQARTQERGDPQLQ